MLHDYLATDLELQLRARTPNWVHDRPPPGTGSYLVSCLNADGRAFVAIKYWSVPKPGSQFEREPYWADVGPGVKVMAWYVEPTPWDGVVRERSVAL